jgi:sarcosine oxidase
LKHHEVIVIGLGAMGSATLRALAGRGVSCLGIEQFEIGHDRGSSHGDTRLIRRGYFEHPAYVPLVDAAFEGWAELETESGKQLFFQTGLFLAGPPEGTLIAGTRLAAQVHSLDIPTLTPAEARSRFPAFDVPPGLDILFEPDAGQLLVEECVRTTVDQARRRGADILAQTPVRSWRPDGSGFAVDTDSGSFRADRLVICGGAWAARLLSDLHLPLEVRRKVVLWYEIKDRRLELAHGCPVFGFDVDGGFFYGFPSVDGQTVKVCEHTGGDPADPDRLDRGLHPLDVARVRGFAERHLLGVGEKLARHSICMYTMSPDEHFIVDRHPVYSDLVFAAGFSGHGFKFAPVIGSTLADMAMGETPPPSFAFLSLSRKSLRGRLSSPPVE